MTENLYVDIHVLQTVPPSCVNRDDMGSPKTAVYGGTTRARVSSQAWKHAIRQYFHENYPDETLGKRTKHIVALLQEAISERKPELSEDEAQTLASKTFEKAGLKIKSADKGTDALFFISEEQVKSLAKLALEGITDKKKLRMALRDKPAIDIVMFGRMIAEDSGESSKIKLNYDATVQVAHSISTHAVHNEYDYFTALDDCSSEDNAGAGHLGTVEFNSATLYRFATVNVNQLAKFVGTETAKAVRNFVEAFIYSMPTGKENTFANRTLPNDIYIAVRKDQPVNLCGAFEKPVQAGQEGYIKASEKAFAAYADNLYQQYDNAPEKAFGMGDGCPEPVETAVVPAVLDGLENYLQGKLENEK
ncbi:type I-E CRISPR-associated protein Cas7/Cse4/CasC [Acidaminococcus sp. LBK-2]|uniref:type I-E CRISPR-associated protein Cas7/Cse4/CasC n=1 Tax=Acidaminococcus sp. LBK-2 TaxID=3456956 RepID=UPI003FA405AD